MIQYLKKVFTKVYYGVENYINYVISLIYIYKNKKRVQKKINNDKVLNVIFLIQYIKKINLYIYNNVLCNCSNIALGIF